MKSLKALFIFGLLAFPFFNEINALLNHRTFDLVKGWQELITYCDRTLREEDSKSYQRITTHVNQRLAYLETKTEGLTVDECLQVYNSIETDPRIKNNPLLILLSRNTCQPCKEAMHHFITDKEDALILHELGAGDKTAAEIKKDEKLQKELQKRTVRHQKRINKNDDNDKKVLEAFVKNDK